MTTGDGGLLLSKRTSRNGTLWLTSISVHIECNVKVFIVDIMEKFQSILFVVE